MLEGKAITSPRANGLLSDLERSMYNGFLELLSCKWLYDNKAPSPFTWEFAAAWIGETKRHAEQAIKGLLSKGVLRIVGHMGKMALFAVGSRSLIKRRLRRRAVHDTTRKQETIAADVQQDVDALLDENAKPVATGECKHGVDTWASCVDCKVEEVQARLLAKRQQAGIRLNPLDPFGLMQREVSV